MATPTTRVKRMPRSLATRNAEREAGLLRTRAAVPRSFSVATLPIASRMAASTPVCPRLRRIWPIESATVGGGTSIWNSAPASEDTSSGV
jgi:hypothetical protein